MEGPPLSEVARLLKDVGVDALDEYPGDWVRVDVEGNNLAFGYASETFSGNNEDGTWSWDSGVFELPSPELVALLVIKGIREFLKSLKKYRVIKKLEVSFSYDVSAYSPEEAAERYTIVPDGKLWSINPREAGPPIDCTDEEPGQTEVYEYKEDGTISDTPVAEFDA